MYGMKIRPKVIAFDFDETITTDDRLFLNIMKTMRNCGFEVIIVTWRADFEYPNDFKEFIAAGFNVYFTNRQAKARFMMDKGVDVDIWVDDNPSSILYNMGEERS